jgi:hypothetical protein
LDFGKYVLLAFLDLSVSIHVSSFVSGVIRRILEHTPRVLFLGFVLSVAFVFIREYLRSFVSLALFVGPASVFRSPSIRLSALQHVVAVVS